MVRKDFSLMKIKAKVYKKYKISNAWAAMILVAVAVDTCIFELAYPYQLSPIAGMSKQA